DQVGTTVHPDRAGDPGHRDRQGRPKAAAHRALGRARSDLVAHGPTDRLPTADRPGCRRPAPRLPRRRARRDPDVKFAITPPLVTHPYHPDLVSGAGVTNLARAAEQAGFHGYGFTDHPSPTD